MNTLLIADGSKLTSAQIDQINNELGTTYIIHLETLGGKGKDLQALLKKGYKAGGYSAHLLKDFIAKTAATHVKTSQALKKRLQSEGVKVKFI